jgi:hypothetical protein
VLVGIFPEFQTESKAPAFPASSEGGSLRDALLTLQGVMSGQRLNNLNCQSVGHANGRRESMVDAGSCTGVSHESDKPNYYGHGVEDQWPWPGRSLDMVEPTPIHGQLLLLV